MQDSATSDSASGAAFRWGRAWLSLSLVATALYVPFSWLVLIDYPWNSYRMMWVSMWPILPGILPAAWLFHGRIDAVVLVASGTMTVLLLAGLVWLGALGRYRLALAVIIALGIAIPSALGARGAFFV